MSRLAATDSNPGKVCLEEAREHRIALNDKQAFWPEAPAKEGPGDSTGARTDFKHGRLGRIYSRGHQAGQLLRARRERTHLAGIVQQGTQKE
jgi:hypothetical protein